MQITGQIPALKFPFQIPVGPGKTFERFVSSYLVQGREIFISRQKSWSSGPGQSQLALPKL